MVWDPAVRTSLVVAFRVAGLERAVVGAEEQSPLVEVTGLETVEDSAARCTGMTDAEIYRRAYDTAGGGAGVVFRYGLG